MEGDGPCIYLQCPGRALVAGGAVHAGVVQGRRGEELVRALDRVRQVEAHVLDHQVQHGVPILDLGCR